MLKILLPLGVLVAAVVLSVLGDRPLPPADFSFINRGDVNTLDLQRMSWMQDLRVARLLWEGLVANDVFSREFGVVPAAAESWEVSEDGLTYTFFLRPDARWSNGALVTAADFVYSWRRGLLPDTASDYFAMFTLIAGAQEFYDWRQAQLDGFTSSGKTARELWAETEAAFDEMVALRAVDDRTLTMTLVRPTPYWLDLCAFAVFYPVYPPLVRQYEHPDPDTGALKIESGWTKPGKLVSNGPFELTVWRFKRDMRFEKNPHYWNRDAIAIDSIGIPSVEDANSQVLAFDSGAAAWVSDVTPPYRGDMLEAKQQFYREHWEQYAALRDQGIDPIAIDRALPPDDRKNIHAFPAFGTYFYNFNCLPTLQDGRPNPFADARVRRAFSMALNKARVANVVRRLGEPVATTLIPPGSLGGYTSPAGLPYDPVAARQLLAGAGFPDGRGFPTVEILVNKDGGHDLIAQAVAKDWEDNLGVRVSLQQREIKVFRNDLKKQNYMVSRAGWYGDYGDPTTFLELNRTGDGNNDREYSSAEYDALLDAANAERDPARRTTLLEEAERIIVERDLPLVPIFHYASVYLFDPHVISGVNSHPRAQQNLYLVDVIGDGKGPDAMLDTPPRAPDARGGGARSVPPPSGPADDSGEPRPAADPPEEGGSG